MAQRGPPGSVKMGVGTEAAPPVSVKSATRRGAVYIHPLPQRLRSMSEASNQANLLAAAKSGDRHALGQLLLMHSDALGRHLAVKMPPSLSRTVSVDDILQQTFFEAYRDIGQFQSQGDGSFYAWLKVIGQHRLQNAIKSASRQKRGGHLKRVEPVVGDNASMRNLLEELEGDVGTASLAVRRGEALTAMNVALAELPDDYREVIRLRFFEGLTNEETAQAMGKTTAAIRSLVDRAKKRLREAIGRLSQFLSTI